MDLRQIFEKHPHWQEVIGLTAKLQRAGFKAYLAGGCVRDGWLGILPQDFDVATDAEPKEVAGLFPKVLEIGKAFGVMMVPFKDFRVEITTFRNDGEYKDGRRPVGIKFSDAKEDALRRDFTINALFYDLSQNEIIDYVHGLEDLRQKIIRAVGSPEKRFTEDKLRILRAARFVAQLGFTLDGQTQKAMNSLSPTILTVSKERITDEFRKMVKTKFLLQGLSILLKTDLFSNIWNLNFIKDKKALNLFLSVQVQLIGVLTLESFIAICILFEMEFKEDRSVFKKILTKNFPFLLSNENKKRVEYLVDGYFTLKSNSEDAIFLLNEDGGPLLTELCFTLSRVQLFPAAVIAAAVETFLKATNKDGRLPPPWINGEDLKKIGIAPSKKMGEILHAVYLAQLKGLIGNKSSALKWVKANMD